MPDTAVLDEVVPFRCGPERLWGILSRPADGSSSLPVAVVILVGGPQYRVGSHRGFVSLARALARDGVPTLRFDYRGMGDSEGDRRDFEAVAPDLRAAVDTLLVACPQARGVVVWGLCDGASAALMFAADDARIHGIVALNPWARGETSLAAARTRGYYLQRLAERAFWTKLLRGGVRWRASFAALAANLAGAYRHRRALRSAADDGSFRSRMATGLARFRGRVLVVLSGNDLTAREFAQLAAGPAWAGLLDDEKVERLELAEADHTFSRADWQRRVEEATVDWIRRLVAHGEATRMGAASVGSDTAVHHP
jgi:exosortase A-associated hydrolase 1